jgi:hypothetical protein
VQKNKYDGRIYIHEPFFILFYVSKLYTSTMNMNFEEGRNNKTVRVYKGESLIAERKTAKQATNHILVG